MSHHYSGPDFGFLKGTRRLDFTDLYAFPKPGETGKIDPDRERAPVCRRKPSWANHDGAFRTRSSVRAQD